jgi:hypothetical protein
VPLTPDELEALARKPAVVSNDAGSVTQRSAADILALDAQAQAAALIQGTNEQGGNKSAWRLLRKALFSPGGGS